MPGFVTAEVFEAAKKSLAKKKPNLDSSMARLEVFHEGLCAQVLHTGSYDSEPATIHALKIFQAINIFPHQKDVGQILGIQTLKRSEFIV